MVKVNSAASCLYLNARRVSCKPSNMNSHCILLIKNSNFVICSQLANNCLNAWSQLAHWQRQKEITWFHLSELDCSNSIRIDNNLRTTDVGPREKREKIRRGRQRNLEREEARDLGREIKTQYFITSLTNNKHNLAGNWTQLGNQTQTRKHLQMGRKI